VGFEKPLISLHGRQTVIASSDFESLLSEALLHLFLIHLVSILILYFAIQKFTHSNPAPFLFTDERGNAEMMTDFFANREDSVVESNIRISDMD